MQHQIVALVKDRKDRWKKAATEVYQTFQKPDLFSGFIRSYKPSREDEAALPPERKNPQASVAKSLIRIKAAMASAFDTVLTQDIGNMKAVADLRVEYDGAALNLTGVPATHLLFLEKQATDLLTMAQAIPVLDSADLWSLDPASGQHRTEAHETLRTRKVPKVIVKYEATKEHPAQTEMIAEDIPVGSFNTVKFSGAVPQARKDEIVSRVLAFQEGVKAAREKANSITVEDHNEAEDIFQFIFGE